MKRERAEKNSFTIIHKQAEKNSFTIIHGECTLRTMMGVMEDNGLLFGLMKLTGEGGSLSGDTSVGTEKSPISLLSTMPVEGDITPAPKR